MEIENITRIASAVISLLSIPWFIYQFFQKNTKKDKNIEYLKNLVEDNPGIKEIALRKELIQGHLEKLTDEKPVIFGFFEAIILMFTGFYAASISVAILGDYLIKIAIMLFVLAYLAMIIFISLISSFYYRRTYFKKIEYLDGIVGGSIVKALPYLAIKNLITSLVWCTVFLFVFSTLFFVFDKQKILDFTYFYLTFSLREEFLADGNNFFGISANYLKAVIIPVLGIQILMILLYCKIVISPIVKMNERIDWLIDRSIERFVPGDEF